MNAEQAWRSVLMQLQLDMPRASFDTWVGNTEAVSLEDGVLTIAARDVYARDWLESRLTSTVERLLIGILNRSVAVRFVVTDAPDQEAEADEADDEQDVELEPVQWLDYEKIVQPHRQIVVKGYLRRLGMEIGPKAIWLYIGFHQAAWRVHASGEESGAPLRSREVMRFSGLSFGAFWRLLRNPEIQSHLNGLVERIDPLGSRRFRRGRDGRPHRVPIHYRVYMAPRLTMADAAAVYGRLKNLLERGAPILNALQELLITEDVMDLLTPLQPVETTSLVNSVMDMARLEIGEALAPDVDHLAQELHRRIVNALGDIHITHYFITQVIPESNLTPAQAWLVTVSRDMAYLNWRSGERREIVTFKGGYQEMAEVIGSGRFKTVQAWFHPDWTTQQRGGDLTRFLAEVQTSESNSYPDLRVESMPRTFRVLLDEPLDANGTIRVGANGSIRLDADGSNSRTQMEVLAGANGSIMVDANGTVLNTLKHPLNTDDQNTSTTEHSDKMAGAAPGFWELETLLRQNNVHPKVQRELLKVQASVHAFVSWVLYAASPQSGNLSDPLGYAISHLREHPLREARGVFRQLAYLPPIELLALIAAMPNHPYELHPQSTHPLAPALKKAMGSNNRRLPAVRTILFGEGGNE